MKTAQNEPAFATADGGNETTTTWHGQKGLTKLEYFTAMAMQGMVANYKPEDFKGGECQMVAHIAVLSISIAVNTIEQLNSNE